MVSIWYLLSLTDFAASFWVDVLQTSYLFFLFCRPEEISSIDEQQLKMTMLFLSVTFHYKTKSIMGSFDLRRTTESLNSN